MAAAGALLAVMGYLSLRRGTDRVELTVGQTTQVTHDPGLELDPTLSPDGRLIAYTAGPVSQMQIYAQQLAGGRTINPTEGLPGNHRWPQWSPDGKSRVHQSAPR